MQVGNHRVGAPEHDEAGVGDLLGEDADVRPQGREGAGGAGAGADGALQAGGAEAGEEAAVHALALDQALGAHVAVGQHRLAAVLGDDLLQPPGDVLQGVIPGHPLEAAFAF